MTKSSSEPVQRPAITVPPYERICLVLQGGGALGSYQAGVYEGLHEAGIQIDYVSGISIGAFNTALIAGNPPKDRVAKLTEFWDTICQPQYGAPMNPFMEQTLFNASDIMRQALSAGHAGRAMLLGQKDFFEPRFPPAAWGGHDDPTRVSYYDTSKLKDTLERLCDFDRINHGKLHVSVGAVNVKSGNMTYFDNQHITLRPEHIMASGALPPAFAAVEIDGQYYWDGGLLSNTPLSRVLSERPMMDTLVFQVDLWRAQGKVPTTLGEVNDRVKDIRYSSRTRQITNQLQHEKRLRRLLSQLLDDIPADLRATRRYCDDVEQLGDDRRYNVIHMIYRNQPYDKYFKDFQFGPTSMRERWSAGLNDMRQTLQQPHCLAMPDNESGFTTHDIHRNTQQPSDP